MNPMDNFSNDFEDHERFITNPENQSTLSEAAL